MCVSDVGGCDQHTRDPLIETLLFQVGLKAEIHLATCVGATRMFHEACWRSNLPCFDKLTIVSKSSESAEPARSGRQISGAWLAAYQHETAQSPIWLITISQHMRSLVLLYAYS